jgi:thiol-disulfide isomerase/thioredoxin
MTVQPTDSSVKSAEMTQTAVANRIRNLVLTLVAIVLSTAIFLGLKTGTPVGSLEALAESSVPLEMALQNGKPTLMEFYANWCTACQAMANDMTELKQTYSDRVNFVMLNVDNTKWLPEMLSYQVDGIPHFVFMGNDGAAIATAIGEQPRLVMAANLEALTNGDELPYTKARGKVSDVENATPKASSDDPRSHGSQVKVN